MDKPATPPLPDRHPGRRVGSNSSDASNAKGVDERNVHIWEHSVTLYHAFDWQSSAENFLFLSRVIGKNLESTLCLLNAAIIFARLGEYGTASQILADAEPTGETMPITMFVWGHVEFELGHFDKAEDSFKVALNSLNGRSHNYSSLGLDFTLKASHIQQDLRVFASRNNLYGFLGTLGALPADAIFNAPSASPICVRPSTVNTRTSTDSGYVPTLADFSTPTSPAHSPVEGYFGNDQNIVWWQGQSRDNDVPVLVRHNSISEALEDVRTGFADLQVPPKMPLVDIQTQNSPSPLPLMTRPPPTDPLPPTPSPSIRSEGRNRLGLTRKLSNRSANHIVTRGLDHSRHPGLQARDARVHGGKTEQLADFILNLPAQNQRMPRDAKISKESTRDLADFLRGAPDHAATSPEADDASVYSSDDPDTNDAPAAVTKRDLHRLASDTFHAPDPLSSTPKRWLLRESVASWIGHPRSAAPSIHNRSTSDSGSNTPALTALPSVLTRSSSLRIPPSTPVPRRLTKKEKKKANQPKMIPVEQATNFTDFFPPFIAKRMSEW